MTKYFYSRHASLMVTVPKEFESVNPDMVGKVLNFTPLGNNQTVLWGLIPAGPDEAAYFEFRRAQQGGNPDILTQEEFNTEMQIESKGVRNVLQETLDDVKRKSAVLQDLVNQGVLDENFRPIAAKMPDEFKKEIVEAAAQQSILDGTPAPTAKGKQHIGMK